MNSEKIADFKYPKDIAEKGNEMTSAYLNLYLLENFIRIFIENKAINKFGNNYWDELTIRKALENFTFNKGVSSAGINFSSSYTGTIFNCPFFRN